MSKANKSSSSSSSLVCYLGTFSLIAFAAFQLHLHYGSSVIANLCTALASDPLLGNSSGTTGTAGYSSANTALTKKMAADTTALAKKYFEAWNAQDLDKLGELFADDVELRDWDIAKSGKKDVVDANGGIFKAVPAIKAEILNIFPSTSDLGPVAACELHIVVSAEETLKVLDVIQYDSSGKIKAVRAYKG